MDFLENTDQKPRTIALDVKGMPSKGRLYLGEGNLGLEIAVFSAAKKPKADLLRQAFKIRKHNRAAPVLIAVLHSKGVSFCGTGGDQPPVIDCGDKDRADSLCQYALKLPDRNAAIRFLAAALPSLETPLPGITNVGFLSLHELIHGTRKRSDWSAAKARAQQVLGRSKRELLTVLEFTSEPLDNLTELLKTRNKRTALAVLLNEDEIPEIGTDRFNGLSPISYALAKADNENLPWVLMVQGERLRLYSTKNIGVGRRGLTETYVECQPSLIAPDDIGLIWLLFSADALGKGGTFDSILEESRRFAASVADKLRDRIYNEVVPKLAEGIASARNLEKPSKNDLALTYEMALTVIFRLLFIAYAEDQDLLPYKSNEAYRYRSLKRKAMELASNTSNDIQNDASKHHWVETKNLWEAVSQGNKEWGVPAYGGTLFSSEGKISKAGAAIAMVTLPNRCYSAVLRGLLLTESEENSFAPIDFRTLSVREFGTIYEGFLESELSQAKEDLAIDKRGTYLPANNKDTVVIKKGEIYLHNRSGARKSSGSYYTPDFLVEYLLDSALEPALDKHLERLEALNEGDQAKQFFDFRVADIAMGSGHFLVAAVDRIERRFALWLESHHLPDVMNELENLRVAAKKELGDLANTVWIEDGSLLRRMIARRCIFGVDLNPVAVQLARLSIWIHTFVPGLPLSLLDHNLVHGNALVGVCSLGEILKKFEGNEGVPLFSNTEEAAKELLGEAKEPLEKLAQLSDASLKDIEKGRDLMEKARQNTQDTEALCDLITAEPVAVDPALKGYMFEDWEAKKGGVLDSPALKSARKILEPFSAMHFPIAFPEVFLGRSQGFDVVLGNPPWEEIKVDEHTFWALHFPGTMSLTQKQKADWLKKINRLRPDLVALLDEEKKRATKLREMIHSGDFPGLGTGDLDLYKAFARRFWQLCSNSSGFIGIVMPRAFMMQKGTEESRKELFREANSITIVSLQNNKQWIFEIHGQFTIVLLSIGKSTTQKRRKLTYLSGPFRSLTEFKEGVKEKPVCVSNDELLSWTETASIPFFRQAESADVMRQLLLSPKLGASAEGDWRAKPDAEMHATNQKYLMDFNKEKTGKSYWPVFKGQSFHHWNPDTGVIYGQANAETALDWLYQKRINSWKNRRGTHSAFSEIYVKDKKTLAPYNPRIAYRQTTRSTDARTMICALVPPRVFLQNSAPCVVWLCGDKCDEAYLLGVLSSIPLDWYSRLFVELSFTIFHFNSLPIPRPSRDNLLWKRVVQLSGRLASLDKRFADWASSVGVDHGPLEEGDKQDKIHELDAVVSHLYGLSEHQIVHIFETFHKGWDFGPRLEAVLKHYRAWAGKE